MKVFFLILIYSGCCNAMLFEQLRTELNNTINFGLIIQKRLIKFKDPKKVEGNIFNWMINEIWIPRMTYTTERGLYDIDFVEYMNITEQAGIVNDNFLKNHDKDEGKLHNLFFDEFYSLKTYSYGPFRIGLKKFGEKFLEIYEKLVEMVRHADRLAAKFATIFSYKKYAFEQSVISILKFYKVLEKLGGCLKGPFKTIKHTKSEDKVDQYPLFYENITKAYDEFEACIITSYNSLCAKINDTINTIDEFHSTGNSNASEAVKEIQKKALKDYKKLDKRIEKDLDKFLNDEQSIGLGLTANVSFTAKDIFLALRKYRNNTSKKVPLSEVHHLMILWTRKLMYTYVESIRFFVVDNPFQRCLPFMLQITYFRYFPDFFLRAWDHTLEYFHAMTATIVRVFSNAFKGIRDTPKLFEKVENELVNNLFKGLRVLKLHYFRECPVLSYKLIMEY